jgi:hypothetical protein
VRQHELRRVPDDRWAVHHRLSVWLLHGPHVRCGRHLPMTRAASNLVTSR